MVGLVGADVDGCEQLEECMFCGNQIDEETANRNEGKCDDCSMFDGEVDSEEW